MKNILTLLICVNFILGCTEAYSKSNQFPGAISDTILPGSLSTALSIKPLKELPASFELDSILDEDTTYNYFTSIYFPKSNTNKSFNQLMAKFIQQQIGLEKPVKKAEDQCTFNMWLIKLVNSENLIQCIFREQSYTEGAAHYNHFYSTFYCDTIKQKRIFFTDIFKFPNRESKQLFCNKLNGYLNGYDDSDGYNDGLSVKNLNEDLQFDISSDKLIIYPNYCCAGEGTTYEIELIQIQEFIKPAVEKEYGLIRIKEEEK
jgi:hypothetical protein